MRICFLFSLVFLPWLLIITLPWLVLFSPLLLIAGIIAVAGRYVLKNTYNGDFANNNLTSLAGAGTIRSLFLNS